MYINIFFKREEGWPYRPQIYCLLHTPPFPFGVKQPGRNPMCIYTYILYIFKKEKGPPYHPRIFVYSMHLHSSSSDVRHLSGSFILYYCYLIKCYNHIGLTYLMVRSSIIEILLCSTPREYDIIFMI
jgi:hypothetical protein